MLSTPLCELATKFGTDKGPGGHNYTPYYHRHFGGWQPQPISLLEIGVYQGASLRMWEHYFPQGTILGVDIDPNAAVHTARAKTVVCDIKDYEPDRTFDLIIDDGSHAPDDIVAAGKRLWPSLRFGGWYVIEDLAVVPTDSVVLRLAPPILREPRQRPNGRPRRGPHLPTDRLPTEDTRRPTARRHPLKGETMSTKEENREGYARRKSDGNVTVHSEPRVYGDGRYSFFRDLALAASGMSAHTAFDASDRLERARIELDGEIRSGSAEGRSAAETRLQEQRAMTTASTSGGDFVSPQWLTDLWAGYRYPNRTLADACTKMPLGAVGVQVNIPSFTGATAAGQQTEGSGVDVSSPSGHDITANVVTIAAQVPVAQQLYDLGGMSGLAFDQIIIEQLRDSIDSQVDLYVWNQVTGGITAAANTITDNSAFSIPNFYADVAAARESLADLAGTRIKATHMFSVTDLFGYVTRQVDATTNRPVFTHDWAAGPWLGLGQPGDDTGDGWTGNVMPSNIPWYMDDNIPASGSNNQILVSRPSSIILLESGMIPFAYVETFAPNLTVQVGLRIYAAAAARFPNAHAVISGNAYATSEV